MTTRLLARLQAVLDEALTGLAGRPAASAVARIGPPWRLQPKEAALVGYAEVPRRLEFAAGRACARRALERLGAPRGPILRGALGEPIWPRGFAGSITHDGRLAAALAERVCGGRGSFSIDLVDGLDPERFREIEAFVLRPDECDACADDPCPIARAFSAKEAAIKLVSPIVGRQIDFQDVRLRQTAHGLWALVEPKRIEVDIYTLVVDDVLVSVGQRREP